MELLPCRLAASCAFLLVYTTDSEKVVLQKHRTLNSVRSRNDGYLHK